MIDLWTITAVLMFTTREFPLLLSRREQFIYKTHCTILGSSSTPGLRHLLGSCNMHKNNNIIIISFNDNQNMLIPHHAMPQIPDSLWAWTGKVVLQSLTAVAESATKYKESNSYENISIKSLEHTIAVHCQVTNVQPCNLS